MEHRATARVKHDQRRAAVARLYSTHLKQRIARKRKSRPGVHKVVSKLMNMTGWFDHHVPTTVEALHTTPNRPASAQPPTTSLRFIFQSRRAED
jgi:hypothetical protein